MHEKKPAGTKKGFTPSDVHDPVPQRILAQQCILTNCKIITGLTYM